MDKQTHPHIMVATPCYGGQVTVAFLRSLLKLQVACAARGIGFEFQDLSGVPLVTYARSELVGQFLDQTNATHLMFIDADIGFEPDQVFRLLDFGGEVVAGIYPRKLIDWNRVEQAVKRSLPPQSAALDYFVGWRNRGPQEIRDGFVRALFVGAGFLMIRRAAVMRLADAHPELRYQRADADPPAFSYGLFENLMLPDNGGWLPEDMAFCRRWTDLGGEIWADTTSKLTHTGPFTFAGDFSTQLASWRGAPDST